MSCETTMKSVDRLQSRAKLIIGCSPQNNLDLSSFKDIEFKKLCLFTFESLYGHLCENFERYFEFLQHQRNTRSGNSSV